HGSGGVDDVIVSCAGDLKQSVIPGPVARSYGVEPSDIGAVLRTVWAVDASDPLQFVIVLCIDTTAKFWRRLRAKLGRALDRKRCNVRPVTEHTGCAARCYLPFIWVETGWRIRHERR